MSLKYDLPDLYVDEAKTYRTYKELGSLRTTTGNLTYTSSSSGTTYSSTTGQYGILQQLETLLTAYKINADDWNDVESSITATDNKIGLLSNLTTTNKTNLVNAINENKATADGAAQRADTGLMYTRGALAANADWNTITTTGTYSVNVTTSQTNHPNMGDYLVLEVYLASSGYIVQRATHVLSSVVKHRYRTETVWGAWFESWNTGKLRTTNGYVEWNNGGTWLPVGGAIMTASSTLQHTLQSTNAAYSVNFNSGGSGTQYALAGKFLPLGTGEAVISAEIAPTGFGAACTLIMYTPPLTGNEMLFPMGTGFDWRTPVGTITTSGAVGATTSISTVNPGVGVYATVTATIMISSRRPVYFFLWKNADSGQVNIRNFTVSYNLS